MPQRVTSRPSRRSSPCGGLLPDLVAARKDSEALAVDGRAIPTISDGHGRVRGALASDRAVV